MLVVESRGVDRLGLMLWIIRLVFVNTSTFLVILPRSWWRYYSELRAVMSATYRTIVDARDIVVTALAENGRTWLAELGRTLRSRDKRTA